MAKGYCEKHYARFKKHGDTSLKVRIPKIKHGMRYTKVYGVWRGIKKRCYNKNAQNYKRYGGRGIGVCEEWRNSFVAFYKDMGDKPFPEAQIDRINNDGNYEPDNCRWVTPADNKRNASSTKMTIQKANRLRELYNSGSVTIKNLSLAYDICYYTAYLIIKNKTWVNAKE